VTRLGRGGKDEREHGDDERDASHRVPIGVIAATLEPDVSDS
jgi:hypothetical protein